VTGTIVGRTAAHVRPTEAAGAESAPEAAGADA